MFDCLQERTDWADLPRGPLNQKQRQQQHCLLLRLLLMGTQQQKGPALP